MVLNTILGGTSFEMFLKYSGFGNYFIYTNNNNHNHSFMFTAERLEEFKSKINNTYNLGDITNLDIKNLYIENIIIKFVKLSNTFFIKIFSSFNDTPCVILKYSTDTKIIELSSLLDDDKITEKHLCRKNKTGKFYLEIIFYLVKALQEKLYNFKPKYFKLTDIAKIDYTKIETDDKKKKIYLSTYKLLTENRTFYEAYGFLPISHSIIDTQINIEDTNTILEKILQTRTQILTIPIQELVDILDVNNASEDIKNELQKICEMIEGYDNSDSSLSGFFKLFVKSDRPDEKLLGIATLIYHFVNINLYKILNLLLTDLKNTISNQFTYVITDKITWYADISALYKKYNITRYDDYSKFLGLIIQSGGINIKKMPPTLKRKTIRTNNSSSRITKTLKNKTPSKITNLVLELQARKHSKIYRNGP